ncbi:hypothetical protein AC792_14595 [Arthrobacter sp. RIT-PI-e]|uniref:sterol carrier family protein n=1 Tax=Arthrobacter sp. RIT-PI-e TaxID=1681197 RepID=UPI000675BDC5|nr:sterol carrier family protein [Arthrobacter sp. RIT-PI-e]KNC17303.1 hypothetical protein AC792_14595 [Arthrobacter sp. RIT-PI-e]
MARRRISGEDGHRALAAVEGGSAVRADLATAVRFALEELAALAPGNSVGGRVPPFGVPQCGAGPRHTRGTPPNVVETDAATWLALVRGKQTWAEAVTAGKVAASGSRADLEAWLPIFGRTP